MSSGSSGFMVELSIELSLVARGPDDDNWASVVGIAGDIGPETSTLMCDSWSTVSRRWPATLVSFFLSFLSAAKHEVNT